MNYIFDTNIFIRSKNDMPADIWPTFWTRIAELIRDGKIHSSIKVKEEIDRGNDELTKWMKINADKNFYYQIDSDVLVKYAEAQNWAKNNTIFKPIAINEFANVADAYLVATAAAKNLTLVTYEKSNPSCRNRVKIPDACIALGVNFCDLNTALKQLNVTI